MMPAMTPRRPVLKRLSRLAALVAVFWSFAGQIKAAETAFVATPVGTPIVVFDPKRDACDGHDVADAPLRAWRGEDGQVHAFALHYENRRLSGKSLLAMKIECPVVYRGTGDGDPARYDDRVWIGATWTADGKTIHALGHHEFQANEHKGRCSFPEYMKCWWNSVIALKSLSGGARFTKELRPVVAVTPFRSEIGQGRHRGFFNPSNILKHEDGYYILMSTTGWDASPGREQQAGGVCLFRASDLAEADWRAYDGKGFNARYSDPYARITPLGRACKVIAPFPAPVGSFVKHRPSGSYLAMFQAAAGTPDGFGGSFSKSGFYLSASRDLLTWSRPTLTLETKSLYDSPCGADVLRSYPVLIDNDSPSRNFEDVGDSALIFYSEMRVEGCSHTGDRKLVARKVRISTYIRE